MRPSIATTTKVDSAKIKILERAHNQFLNKNPEQLLSEFYDYDLVCDLIEEYTKDQENVTLFNLHNLQDRGDDLEADSRIPLAVNSFKEDTYKTKLLIPMQPLERHDGRQNLRQHHTALYVEKRFNERGEVAGYDFYYIDPEGTTHQAAKQLKSDINYENVNTLLTAFGKDLNDVTVTQNVFQFNTTQEGSYPLACNNSCGAFVVEILSKLATEDYIIESNSIKDVATNETVNFSYAETSNKVAEIAIKRHKKTIERQQQIAAIYYATNGYKTFRSDAAEELIKATSVEDLKKIRPPILHSALQDNKAKTEIIKWLIEQKVGLNLHDAKGLTPIHYAALYRTEFLSDLVKNGWNIDTKSRNETTATPQINLKKLFLDIAIEKDPDKKARKIEQLHSLLSQVDDNVKNLHFKERQEDCSEFLLPLLGVLNEGKEPFIYENSLAPADTNNQLKVKQKPKIYDRGNSIISLEIANPEGDVGGTLYIKDLIENHTKQEIIKDDNIPSFVLGEGEEGAEESGSLPLTAKKTTKLLVAPNATEIFFSFKRFKTEQGNHQNAIATSKISRNIHLEDSQIENKERKDVLKFDLEGSGNKNFKLTGFIVHRGDTLASGHYVTYALELDKNNQPAWYLYNDHKKTKIEPRTYNYSLFQEDISTAYIVKYSAMDDSGKFLIPQSTQQFGATNLNNTCWANSAIALLASSSLTLTKEQPQNLVSQHNVMENGNTNNSSTLQTPESFSLRPPIIPISNTPELNKPTRQNSDTLHALVYKYQTTPAEEFFTEAATKQLAKEKLGNDLMLVMPTKNWVKDQSKFSFTTKADNSDQKNYKDLIAATIEAARSENGTELLTEKEAGAIILIAIKNGGISSNPNGLLSDIESIIGKIETTKTAEELAKAAKKFSKAFQDQAAENKLFTGNKDAKNFVGMRLKRVDPSFAQELLGEKYEEISKHFNTPPQSSPSQSSGQPLSDGSQFQANSVS